MFIIIEFFSGTETKLHTMRGREGRLWTILTTRVDSQIPTLALQIFGIFILILENLRFIQVQIKFSGTFEIEVD